MRDDARLQWLRAASINSPDKYLAEYERFRKEIGASTETKSRWVGSEIGIQDVPCVGCGGSYLHDMDCPNDLEARIKRAPRLILSGSSHIHPVCPACLVVGGHRYDCIHRKAEICHKCQQEINSAHTAKMCLIKQAVIRMHARKKAETTPEAIEASVTEPCSYCGGLVNHTSPCPVVNVRVI